MITFVNKFPKTYEEMINAIDVDILVAGQTISGRLSKPEDFATSIILVINELDEKGQWTGKTNNVEISVEDILAVKQL